MFEAGMTHGQGIESTRVTRSGFLSLKDERKASLPIAWNDFTRHGEHRSVTRLSMS